MFDLLFRFRAHALVKYDPNCIKYRTFDYQTAIHAAARYGNEANVDFLTKLISPTDTDVNGADPLSCALCGGHNNLAKSLMSHPVTALRPLNRGDYPFKAKEADDTTEAELTKEQERKRTCLEYFQQKFLAKPEFANFVSPEQRLLAVMAVLDQKAIQGCLLQYPDLKIDTVDPLFCENALHRAVNQGDIAMVQFLLKMPTIDINKLSNGGEHVLHLAIAKNDLRMIELLLSLPNIDVNAPEKFGKFTPLHEASNRGYLDAVKLLLRHRNINVDKLNSEGLKADAIAEGCYEKAIISAIAKKREE